MNPELKKLLSQQNATIKAMGETIAQRDAQIKQTGEAQEKTGRKVDQLGKDLGEIKKAIDAEMAKGGFPIFGSNQAPAAKSVGEKFTGSELFKSLSKDPSNVGALRGVAVDVKSFHSKANTITTDGTLGVDGNGGVTLQPYRPTEWIDETEKTLSVRDLLSSQSISQGSIEYVRITGFTNNANYRAETAAAAQSGLQFDLETETVRSIAHWMPASNEILADQSRMQNFINQKLVYGVKEKEDKELLYGTGVGNSITGLMVDADVPTFSRKAANDTMIDIIRRSMTDVRLTEYAPTGIVVNPIDFESIELMKGTDGHYIWLSIPTGTGSQMFRLPVAEVASMQQNNFLVGAFAQGATLYDRETANVRISESHDDFFTRGMVAIKAEERIALTIERPQAFVKGTFTTTA